MPELAYDGPLEEMDAGAGYSVALLEHPTAREAQALHHSGVKIGLIWSTFNSDPAVDAQQAYQQARTLGVTKETTIFAVVGDGTQETIHRYYSVWAGVVFGNGFTPGLCAGRDIIDSLIEPGYRGVWWQDNVGEVSPHAYLYRVAGSTSEIVVPFPVWGPATIPPPEPVRRAVRKRA